MKKIQREPTPFEEKVYTATRKIPRGKVTTYGLLAKAVGCGSSRAVGQALARNPFAPEVPCHRVIRSDMTTGGFHGRVAGPIVSNKVRLLKKEGVSFDDGRLCESKAIYHF